MPLTFLSAGTLVDHTCLSGAAGEHRLGQHTGMVWAGSLARKQSQERRTCVAMDLVVPQTGRRSDSK